MFLAMFCGPIFGVFAAADLYGPNDRCHVMRAFALASRATANQAFVNFDRMLASNTVPLWPDHA